MYSYIFHNTNSPLLEGWRIMNYIGTYLSLQFKKLFQLFPRLIGGTIVLTALVSAIAFCGTKLLYNHSAADKVTIALVIEDDSTWMQLGLKYLESSESVNSFCELVQTNQDEAAQMLEEGQAIASIYFPDSFSDKVISGENTPATITFAGHPGIEQMLFRELSDAATHILSYAQANIYTVKDLYSTYSFIGKKGKHYDYLNKHTMQTALVRSKLFKVERVSSTQELSTMQYYTASGIVLLLFLSVMSLGSFAQAEPEGLANLLALHGLTAPKRALLKTLALTLFYALLWGLLFSLAAASGLLPWKCMRILPITAVFSSCLTMFLYNLTGSVMAGTLFTFFATFMCSIASGCLIPPAFLPESLVRIGRVLPTYYVHQQYLDLFMKKPLAKGMAAMLLYSALFLALAFLFARLNERRRNR